MDQKLKSLKKRKKVKTANKEIKMKFQKTLKREIAKIQTNNYFIIGTLKQHKK